MANLRFDPANTLYSGLKGLSPTQAISLGISLCHAVEQAGLPSGVHGSIWPGNITCSGSDAVLGPVSDFGLKDMEPGALEYISPEQFWNGECTPASDVYSIGLIVYTALNGGLLPFFEEKDRQSAEDRASALQKRMRGNNLPYPKYACRELGDVILTATAFRASDRYPGVAALRNALEALPESASLPASAPVIRLEPEQLSSAHSYKVDKSFEKTTPPPATKNKKPKTQAHVDENMDSREFRRPTKKRSFLLPIIIVAVLVAAIVLVIKGCSSDPDDNGDLPPVSSVTPDISPDVSAEPGISVTTPEPVASPEPTPVATPEPRYTVILDDVTWEQAKANCEAMGGHLATINSQEEFDKLTAMAAEKGAQFVWLGSYRGSDNQWYHVTGETVDFFKWDSGEPSVKDSDGTPENYLLLWYRTAAGQWSYNDMRNDPISVLPRTYSGKTAYICQFD